VAAASWTRDDAASELAGAASSCAVNGALRRAAGQGSTPSRASRDGFAGKTRPSAKPGRAEERETGCHR
jgi:hypothetical protein